MPGFTGMDNSVFIDRVLRMQKIIREKELDCAYIFSDEYRPGFTTYFSNYRPINMIEESPQGVYIPPEGDVVLFLGAINAQAARRVSWIKDIRSIETMYDFFDDLRNRLGRTIRLGISGQDLLPVKYYRRLQKLLSNMDYVDIDAELMAMRQIKIPDEIALLEKSAEIGDEALFQTIERLQSDDSATEIDLCATAEYAVKSNGADLACATVLSSGSNTEAPTWRPSHKIIKPGEAVIMDVAPLYKGYSGDTAVTVIKGKGTQEQERIVLMARDVVVDAIERLKAGDPAHRIFDLFLAGAKASSMDQYFTPYAKGFRAVGHSIGLDCVERPNLDSDATFLLEPGMTLALKFDLHGMDWGGLRIEAVMAVGDTGCRSLNKFLYKMK